MKLLSLFLCILTAESALITNNGVIPTVPLRVDGWYNRAPLINYELGKLGDAGKIALVQFNPLNQTFEEILRSGVAQNAAGLIFKGKDGDLFYKTDGSGTKEISLPAVEMNSDDFDQLSVIGWVNLTFVEHNKYIEFDRTDGWAFFKSVYIVWIVALILLIFWKFYEFNIHVFLYKRYLPPDVVILFIILIIEFVGNVIRLINAVNLNDTSLLYHYKVTRVTYTLHLPLFIISNILVGLWAAEILSASKKLQNTLNIFSRLKYTFIIISIILLTLELITQIGNFTFAVGFPYWGMIVLGIYVIADIGVIILYTITFTQIIRQFAKSKSVKAKTAVHKFTSRVLISNFGMLLWLIMLIMQFIPVDLPAKRYTGLVGFFGTMISSTGLLLSFEPNLNHEVKSKTGSTKTNMKTPPTADEVSL